MLRCSLSVFDGDGEEDDEEGQDWKDEDELSVVEQTSTNKGTHLHAK